MADTDNVAAELLRQQQLDRAMRMRVRGAHWNEVAKACGYPSPAAALSAVGAAMAAATLRAEETADQMRDTANLRLEHLLSETFAMLEAEAPVTYDADGNELGGDDRAVKLRAVDEARRLVGDIVKLNGVDKPKAAGEDETTAGGIRIVFEQRPVVRKDDAE